MASLMLAGGRRAASVVVAGARHSAGLLVHPRAARVAPQSSILPTLPAPRRVVGGQIGGLSPQPGGLASRVPPPAFFSASRALSGSGGGAGGKQTLMAWMKTVESYLADIFSQGGRLERNSLVQISALKGVSTIVSKLESTLERKTNTIPAFLSVVSSLSVACTALYFLGIVSGHVDASESAKGLLSKVLDDEEIAEILDAIVARLSGTAIRAANPFRRLVNWMFGEEQDPNVLQEKISKEAIDCWAAWASTFAYLVMSILQPYGGYTVSEDRLWLCLTLIGVKDDKENRKLLDILVREGYILRDERGGASFDIVTYMFAEKAFKECTNGRLKQKIKPALEKEHAMMMRLPSTKSLVGSKPV
ncbi:hypothetical protein E2562_012627 [Oryza meyeriana var. granulata]|uniref:MAGE domain-containing protein n=1 Tax=Oryza meyeriana var. granulata TaxID=110450 RepID=A0A6G1CFT7_9ORYZ|nr:hypothetical protein E2562_012627 [Oryza meyeriana var. granulata]